MRLREERLRRFNRMVSHELKNPHRRDSGRLGAVRRALARAAETAQFLRIVAQNAEGLQSVLENLIALSRIDSDSRQRNVLLPQAAAEAVRQPLVDSAAVRGVRVIIAEDLPNVGVDAATVELCLVNLLSNGIKYSNPSRPARTVHVAGEMVFGPRVEDCELRVTVRDNGLGVPERARDRLFTQFYRAHTDTITGVEGTGLGLSIVRETVEAVGGRVWAEFPAGGRFDLRVGGHHAARKTPRRREYRGASRVGGLFKRPEQHGRSTDRQLSALATAPQQRVRRVRLRQEREVVQHVSRGVGIVARHHQHADIGRALAQAVEQHRARHLRHHEVGDHEVERLARGARLVPVAQRVGAMARLGSPGVAAGRECGTSSRAPRASSSTTRTRARGRSPLRAASRGRRTGRLVERGTTVTVGASDAGRYTTIIVPRPSALDKPTAPPDCVQSLHRRRSESGAESAALVVKNSSKARARVLVSIPTPLSFTTSAT